MLLLNIIVLWVLLKVITWWKDLRKLLICGLNLHVLYNQILNYVLIKICKRHYLISLVSTPFLKLLSSSGVYESCIQLLSAFSHLLVLLIVLLAQFYLVSVQHLVSVWKVKIYVFRKIAASVRLYLNFALQVFVSICLAFGLP